MVQDIFDVNNSQGDVIGKEIRTSTATTLQTTYFPEHNTSTSSLMEESTQQNDSLHKNNTRISDNVSPTEPGSKVGDLWEYYATYRLHGGIASMNGAVEEEYISNAEGSVGEEREQFSNNDAEQDSSSRKEDSLILTKHEIKEKYKESLITSKFVEVSYISELQEVKTSGYVHSQ